MWPLLLCSMAVVFIAVERILYYRKVISPEAFVSADECGEKEGSPRYGGRCARGCGFSGLPDHR